MHEPLSIFRKFVESVGIETHGSNYECWETKVNALFCSSSSLFLDFHSSINNELISFQIPFCSIPRFLFLSSPLLSTSKAKIIYGIASDQYSICLMDILWTLTINRKQVTPFFIFRYIINVLFIYVYIRKILN